MLVDFNTLPEESRVWIYQANRSFTDDEIVELESKLDTFISNWTAHGSDLQSGQNRTKPYFDYQETGIDIKGFYRKGLCRYRRTISTHHP